jgi:predicted peptidase
MRSIVLVVAVLAGLLLAPLSSLHAANPNDFVVYNLLNSSNNVILPGRLYVPPTTVTDPLNLRPLILFFHGSGESGTNNTAQVNGNIDNLFTAAKNRGAFLYAPQTNAGWDSATILTNALTMVDRAIAERNVDPNRIYVTGLSMGGGGTWNFLNRFHDRVAATVPICAVPPWPSFDYNELIDEPIWAHHGRFDSTVSANYTRSIINNFLALAGQPLPTYPALNTFGPTLQFDFPPLNLHYTDWRGSHGIWGDVYNTPALYDWMFAQSSVPEPTAALLLLSALLILPRRYGRRVPLLACPAVQ